MARKALGVLFASVMLLFVLVSASQSDITVRLDLQTRDFNSGLGAPGLMNDVVELVHRVGFRQRSARQPTGRQRAQLLMVAHSAEFQHEVVRRTAPHQLSVAEQAVADLAQRSGEFAVRHVYTREELAGLGPQVFEEFDAVLFFTTGDLPLREEVRRSFFESIRGGRGFVGVHSATDTWHNVPEYAECIGGRFDGHPWHERVRIVVEDRADPATRHLGEAFAITDEIYQFREWARESVHVLLCLDPRSVDVTKGARRDQDYALAWYRTCGSGRVFYTALGHRPEVWADDRFRLHLLEGIRWALRLR